MTFPNIPNVTPHITLNRNDAVNLLLASIAFEELGLAHIINAEAEKIQYVLGTNPGIQSATAINNSVMATLRTVTKKEMLLQFKLEDIICLIQNCEQPVHSKKTTTFRENVRSVDDDKDEPSFMKLSEKFHKKPKKAEDD